MSNLLFSVILVVAGLLSLLACVLVSYVGRRRVVEGTMQESLLAGLTFLLFLVFFIAIVAALFVGFGIQH